MFNNKFRIGVLQHPGYHKGKGGGGGSAQPTQSTNYTTNIPEYAKPYVENMLNAAQAQIYDPSMSTFNKYVPYSTDPTKYVAGFSPLQSYAQSGAAGLTLPANYGLATGQTLGTGAQLGMLAPQMGMAGANYGAMATSPYATNAYMNPYLRSSLAPQLEEARRQYDITGLQQQAAATRAGGFGGSREALMAAENRRNMAQQMNQMIGQGYNQAFNQAQQAQQFGANLGLQGQQAQAGALAQQLATANQLAGLGGQQLQAQQGIYNLQNQLGAQQQQQQQNIINQAVQNYATEQQYPFMQLGVLNSMLRGLPMQQSSTQMYQAPPSTISQLAGLGTAGLGALGMYNAATGSKRGGLQEVKKMADGGTTAVPMKRFSDPQLNQVMGNPGSDLMDKLYAQNLLQNRQYIKANPLASNVMAQPLPQTQPMPAPDQMAMAPQTRAGLDAIGTGDTVQMAGGGLLAFADGDVVPEMVSDSSDPKFADQFFDPVTKKFDVNQAARYYLSHKDTATSNALKGVIKDYQDTMAERKKTAGSEALLRAGLGIMAGTSPHALVNIGKGAIEGVDYMSKEGAANAADRKEIARLTYESAKADQDQTNEMIGKATTLATNQQIADAKEEANKLWHQQLEHDKALSRDIRIRTSDLGVSDLYSDDDVAKFADHFRKTGELPAGIRKGSILNSRIQKAAQVQTLNEGKTLDDMYNDQNQYQGQKKNVIATYTEFGPKGKSGRDLSSANTSMGHAEDFKTIIDALDNNKLPAVNAVVNKLHTELGGKKVTDFESVKTLLADEVAKSAIGGQTAQKDREGFAEIIKNTQNSEQLKSAIENWQNFIGTKVASAHLAATSSGMPSDVFLQKLNPYTVKYATPHMTIPSNSKAANVVPQQQNPNELKIGSIVGNHEYLGGDKKDPKSWRAVDLTAKIPK